MPRGRPPKTPPPRRSARIKTEIKQEPEDYDEKPSVVVKTEPEDDMDYLSPGQSMVRLRPKRRRPEEILPTPTKTSLRTLSRKSSEETPAKKRKLIKPKKHQQVQVLSPINHHVPPDADSQKSDDSNYVPKEQHIRELCGKDYKKRMFAAIRLYSYMSGSINDDTKRPRPFLFRNLMYVKAYKHKEVPKFTFGKGEPPLFWPYPVKRRAVPLSRSAKQTRLSDCLSALKFRTKLERTIQLKHPPLIPTKFSIGTLGMYGTMKEAAINNDRVYRRKLEKAGKKLPPMEPICYEIEVLSPASPETPSDTATPTPSPSPEKEKIYYHSLVFNALRHQLVGGERIARVQVFTVEQTGKKFLKPVRLPSTTFTMDVNIPQNILIDLPVTEDCRKGIQLHILLRVDISSSTSDVSVEGRSLRKTPSRASNQQTPIESPEKSPKKRRLSYHWETTYWGTRSMYLSDQQRNTGDGFILGELNVTLVEVKDLGPMNDPLLLPDLMHLAKKRHSNPFIQVSLGKFVLEDSSESESDAGSVASMKPLRMIEAKQEPRNAREDSQCSQVSKGSKKKEEEHTPMRDVLDMYSGKFKMDKGKYVNDKRTLEEIFGYDLLRDKSKRDIVASWMPLRNLNAIKYRLLCINPDDVKPNKDPTVMQSQKGRKKKLTGLSDKDKQRWTECMQSNNPLVCIICTKKFPNLFVLMLHYYASYPRLAFSFDMERKLKPSSHGLVHVDVSLDPFYADIMEVKRGHTRRPHCEPIYLMTKEMARKLRGSLRMDQTLFCDILKSHEIVREETAEETRFVDISTGRKVTIGERMSMNPKRLPQPNWKFLVNVQTETIQDYIDIDHRTKLYMCNWNKMVLAIGRANINIAGSYMLHRLFMLLFGEHMKETEQTSRFHMQLCEETARGTLSGDDHYDLLCRLKRRKYNPLFDPLSSLRQKLIAYACLQHRKYLNAMDHADRGASSNVRRSFPRIFRKNPNTLSKKEDKQLIRYLMKETDALPKIDPHRQYLSNPIKLIFGGRLPKTLAEITPIC